MGAERSVISEIRSAPFGCEFGSQPRGFAGSQFAVAEIGALGQIYGLGNTSALHAYGSGERSVCVRAATEIGRPVPCGIMPTLWVSQSVAIFMNSVMPPVLGSVIPPVAELFSYSDGQFALRTQLLMDRLVFRAERILHFIRCKGLQ